MRRGLRWINVPRSGGSGVPTLALALIFCHQKNCTIFFAVQMRSFSGCAAVHISAQTCWCSSKLLVVRGSRFLNSSTAESSVQTEKILSIFFDFHQEKNGIDIVGPSRYTNLATDGNAIIKMDSNTSSLTTTRNQCTAAFAGW